MKSFRITSDFEGLVKAFEAAPEKTKVMVKHQLKMAARDIKERASDHHGYTSRSGTLERRGVIYRVEDARVVLALNPNVPYAVHVHEGTPPHIIEPREKMVLRWVSRGEFAFAKRVNHPGTEKDPFLYDAADHELPKIQSRFANALESLLGAL